MPNTLNNIDQHLKEEAILLGILYTDGCLSKKSKNCWRFYLSNTSFEIIQVFKDCMISVFHLDSKRVRISQKEINGRPFYRAVVDSGDYGEYLTQKYGTFRTLAYSKNIYPKARLPIEFLQKGNLAPLFLKAAFSCDGGIKLYVGRERKNYRFLMRNVFLSCHHPQLRLDYQKLLSLLGVKAVIIENDNRILIRNKKSILIFAKKIGFLEGVKITQHSTYWHGWEKNKVLNLAIASYGNPKIILKMKQFN